MCKIIIMSSVRVTKKLIFSFRPPAFYNNFFLFNKTKYLTSSCETFCTCNENQNLNESYDSSEYVSKKITGKFNRPFIWNYLTSEPKFKNIIFNSTVSTENTKNFDSVTLIEQYNVTKNSEILTDFSKVIENEIRDLSYKEFLIYLKVFLGNQWEVKEFENVFQLLDNELFKRFTEVSDDEVHQSLSLLYNTRYHRNFSYFLKIALKCLRRLHNLTPEQMVHTMFISMKFRREFFKEFKFKMFTTLCSTMPHFNIIDVAVICHSLRSTEINISHPDFIRVVLQKLTDNIDKTDEASFSTICMLISKGKLKKFQPERRAFQEICIPYVPKLSIESLCHALSVNLNTHSVSLPFFESCMKKVKENIDNCTLECMDGLLYLMLSLNLIDEEFVTMVEKKLEKERKLGTSLFDFLPFLFHFSFLSKFDENLLKAIMTEDFARQLQLQRKRLYDKTMWWLHLQYTLELEKPELSCQLDPHLKKSFWALLSYKKNIFQSLKTGFYQLYSELLKICENDNYLSSCRLPQLPFPVIFMRFDKNLNPLPLPETWREIPKYELKRAEEDGHVWVAFCLTNFLSCGMNGVDLNYYARGYIRQLTIAGYNAITVPVIYFQKKTNTEISKEFFTDLIEKKLREIEDDRKPCVKNVSEVSSI